MRDLFGRLDPRARVLSVVAATVIVGSTTRGELAPFAAYFPLILAMIVSSRAGAAYLASRCLVASPFILLASILLAFQPEGGPAAAASVAMKGYAAALLLALLTATTPLPDLLWALRRLHVPESLSLILGMMHRYTGLLSDEYARMARARDSRTVQSLGRLGFAAHGGHLGTLVLRSWDRAGRIHGAMLSRGFNGAWPSLESRRFDAVDAIYTAAVPLLFLAVARLAA